jgi:hypothetical protein
MSTQQPGLIYRLHPLALNELKERIKQQFFAQQNTGEVFAFAGNTVELTPIVSVASVDDLQFESEYGPFDFGHVFSEQAELRWKCQGQQYDVLLLTETPISALQGQALKLDSALTMRRPKNKDAWIVLNPRSGYDRMDYAEYVGANQAVYFVRYMTCSK